MADPIVYDGDIFKIEDNKLIVPDTYRTYNNQIVTKINQKRFIYGLNQFTEYFKTVFMNDMMREIYKIQLEETVKYLELYIQIAKDYSEHNDDIKKMNEMMNVNINQEPFPIIATYDGPNENDKKQFNEYRKAVEAMKANQIYIKKLNGMEEIKKKLLEIIAQYGKNNLWS